MDDKVKEKSLEEEKVVNDTPVTKKKETEGGRRKKGNEEEEDPDARETDGGDRSAKENVEPSMKLLFEYAKENRGRFAEVMKSENLENSPPNWDEAERKENEKESVKKLLSEMKAQIETLVVKHEDKHIVTFVYNKKQESFELSLSVFVDEFRNKVNEYDADGLMSVLLPEQSESFLKILIECQLHESVKCAIDGIDDSFGSANMMKLFLTIMEELVDWQVGRNPIVNFSEENTIELMKALEFMKVFEDTRDSNVRKYCCILMFLMLTTDAYIENMRRASWVQALKKKREYLEKKREVGRGASIRNYLLGSLDSELNLLNDILNASGFIAGSLRKDNALFDEMATVFGFVFNTAKVFHLISEAYDALYKNDRVMMEAKVDFLTRLLDKVSQKYMDKANEKALAGDVDASSTSYLFRRNTNVVVIIPLRKFKTFISEEKDELIRYFWKFVLSTVGPSETFVSDQLLFDMTFSCRDLRVEEEEKGGDAIRREEIWMKIKNNLFNLGHVNVSYPLASGSQRPGDSIVYFSNSFVPAVFSENVEKNMKEETKYKDEVIIFEDDEDAKEEEDQQRQQQGNEQDRKKEEARNEQCEQVARTQRYYYLLALSEQFGDSGKYCIAHSMQGMRVTGILRSAFGETREWGNGTKRGEQTLEYLQKFMKRMLDQTKKYYTKIQSKLVAKSK